MSENNEFRPNVKQAEEAMAFLSQEIDGPAYFARLAEHGIEPRTQKEAEQLFEVGLLLDGAAQDGQLKQASAGGDNAFLNEALRRLNPMADVPQEQLEAYSKEAAEKLPLAKAAALVYAHMLNGGEVADESSESDETED